MHTFAEHWGALMTDRSSMLSGEEQQELVRGLAEHVLQVTAPEELVLFDETAEEYFADPDGVLKGRGREEPVGFGAELALLTPYILAIVTPVIQLIADMVGRALKEEGGQRSVSSVIRRLLHRPAADADHDTGRPSSLSPEQLQLVRSVAMERGRAVGLPGEQAALLADAIVGGVAVGGTA